MKFKPTRLSASMVISMSDMDRQQDAHTMAQYEAEIERLECIEDELRKKVAEQENELIELRSFINHDSEVSY